MRNTLPILSRPTTLRASSPPTATPPPQIPTIRLIEATPGMTPNTTVASVPWTHYPSPLAPRSDADVPRTRLVPKKSKLSLLGVAKKDKEGRHVGHGSSGRGGFEISVDSTYDPDIGEILMVKKKKSRAALDGLHWGALGEVTNVPSAVKQKRSGLQPKTEEKEKDKWWTIGRGRKDSKEKVKEKEKEREKEKEKERERAKEKEKEKEKEREKEQREKTKAAAKCMSFFLSTLQI
jgi:serine/arginine repetitive matrix protein 2